MGANAGCALENWTKILTGMVRAKKTLINGIVFDSKSEAERALVLMAEEGAGKIGGLEFHVPIDMVIEGVKVGRYTIDFRYFEMIDGLWVPTFEEHKGFLRSRDAFRIKVFRALNQHMRFVKSGTWNTGRRKNGDRRNSKRAGLPS